MKISKVSIIILIALVLMGTGIFAYLDGFFSEKNKPNDTDALKNNTEISNEQSKKDNENKEFYIDGVKVLGDIEISNIKITLLESKKCEFTADVKNTSIEYLKATNVRIKVIDKNGKVDEIFGGGITQLAPHEANSFKTFVLADVTDAKDIEFEIIN